MVVVAPHTVTPAVTIEHNVDSEYMSFNCTTKSTPRGPTPPFSCAIELESDQSDSSGSQAVPVAVPAAGCQQPAAAAAAAAGPDSCPGQAPRRRWKGRSELSILHFIRGFSQLCRKYPLFCRLDDKVRDKIAAYAQTLSSHDKLGNRSRQSLCRFCQLCRLGKTRQSGCLFWV
jgi:hypothetical protein